MANPRPDPARYTYVYHPSIQHKERWETKAAKARTSLSKFIIAAVDGLIDENEEFAPRRDMVRELESLRKENKALREDLRQKAKVMEMQEKELQRYRSAPWAEEDFGGARRLSEQLVEILKARGTAEGARLLEELGIDRRETDLIKAVNRQLETLAGYGIIKQEGRTWRWIA